jgi:hypothetical protein
VHLGADGDPGQVIAAIETDRWLWVQALAAAGCQVLGLNRSRSRGWAQAGRGWPGPQREKPASHKDQLLNTH